jgi:hypothetical protein
MSNQNPGELRGRLAALTARREGLDARKKELAAARASADQTGKNIERAAEIWRARCDKLVEVQRQIDADEARVALELIQVQGDLAGYEQKLKEEVARQERELDVLKRDAAKLEPKPEKKK